MVLLVVVWVLKVGATNQVSSDDRNFLCEAYKNFLQQNFLGQCRAICVDGKMLDFPAKNDNDKLFFV